MLYLFTYYIVIAFFRVMDSLQECAETKDPALISATVSCVETFLLTLLNISKGQAINHIYVTKINMLYPTLKHADYKGWLTIRSKAIENAWGCACFSFSQTVIQIYSS